MIVGIDLAGPTNAKDTSLALIGSDNCVTIHSNLTDSDIFSLLGTIDVHSISIDAPLSYCETGGYRDSDRALRELLNSRGFAKIGVMAPTFNRMIYLTARGIRLTRLLSKLPTNPPIFEAHPGATLALAGYDYNCITSVKSDPNSVKALQIEFENEGYTFASPLQNDHELMAFGVALAGKQHTVSEHHWSFLDSGEDSYPFIT